nr:TonB family protein [uncultured Celeribacter sp.]
MKRIVTGAVFLSLALGVHFAVAAARFMSSEDGASSAGNGGDAVLSLEASTAAVAAMVETWESPPEVVAETETTQTPPDAPEIDTSADLPVMAQAETLPDRDIPMPVQQVETPEAPEQFEAPKAPEALKPPEPEPQPDPKPEPKPEPKPAPAKPVAGGDRSSQATTAAGRGGGAQAGQARASQGASLSASQRQSKIRQWGNSIRARIERRKRAPRNAGVGQVLIVVSVDAAGQLRGVRVRQSSGNPVLDEAALDAARRAGKFPKAPVPLDSNYAELTIPIVFSR